MTQIIHTAESLEEVYGRNPRELDAIAHEAIFNERVEWLSFGGDDEPCTAHPNDDGSIIAHTGIPTYGADLNAAALLEQELERKGKRQLNIGTLVDICDTEGNAIFASAKQRTIAAILTTQGGTPCLGYPGIVCPQCGSKNVIYWDRVIFADIESPSATYDYRCDAPECGVYFIGYPPKQLKREIW